MRLDEPMMSCYVAHNCLEICCYGAIICCAETFGDAGKFECVAEENHTNLPDRAVNGPKVAALHVRPLGSHVCSPANRPHPISRDRGTPKVSFAQLIPRGSVGSLLRGRMRERAANWCRIASISSAAH